MRRHSLAGATPYLVGILLGGVVLQGAGADSIDSDWQAELEGKFPKTAAEIIAAATTIPSSGPERPLPLISSWEYGARDRMGPGNWAFNPSPNVYNEGWFSPGFQMRMIGEGVHLLPVLDFSLAADTAWEERKAYYQPALEELKKHGLPFSLISSEWEAILSKDERFTSLPPEENPQVVTPEGEILPKLDPFAPTKLWYEAGRLLTDTAFVKKMQEVYPDPPRVIFVSNNEHPLLRWGEIEKSRRYLEKFGKDQFDDAKRHAIAQAWKEKYRALQKGMRDGLTSPAWKKNAIFIGYSSAAPFGAMGMFPGWVNYSIHSHNDLVPQAEMWDGATPSYYLHAFRDITDYTVDSPQVESMSLVEALKEVYKVNPSYWFELSVWDGATPPGSKTPSKVQRFLDAGQTWNEARYAGFAQFGLWLLRPRVLREYRVEYRKQDLAIMESYFRAMAACVDRVSESAVLRKFWREGTVVPNLNQEHPYQHNIPVAIRKWPRWFLLEVEGNPKPPLDKKTEIPVYALALARGEKPERQWLVYAHSPLRDREDVKITIPDYGEISMNVTRGGNFTVVDEKNHSARALEDL